MPVEPLLKNNAEGGVKKLAPLQTPCLLLGVGGWGAGSGEGQSVRTGSTRVPLFVHSNRVCVCVCVCGWQWYIVSTLQVPLALGKTSIQKLQYRNGVGWQRVVRIIPFKKD